MPNVDRIAMDVLAELARAQEKHPTAFHSAHEGWAVLDEEARELRNEVYWGPTQPVAGLEKGQQRRARIRAEALQVAAMAIRLIHDTIDVMDESA